MHLSRAVCVFAAMLAIPAAVARAAGDPLAAWNDGAAKQSIVRFVERVRSSGTADFVPPAERIAVFDNDGTLWAEQPMYSQAFFAFDRVRSLAPQHPSGVRRSPSPRCCAGREGRAAREVTVSAMTMQLF